MTKLNYKGKDYYAVRYGREPGVYNSWSEARAQVDGYSNAEHQKFPTLQSAQNFVDFCRPPPGHWDAVLPPGNDAVKPSNQPPPPTYWQGNNPPGKHHFASEHRGKSHPSNQQWVPEATSSAGSLPNANQPTAGYSTGNGQRLRRRSALPVL